MEHQQWWRVTKTVFEDWAWDNEIMICDRLFGLLSKTALGPFWKGAEILVLRKNCVEFIGAVQFYHEVAASLIPTAPSHTHIYCTHTHTHTRNAHTHTRWVHRTAYFRPAVPTGASYYRPRKVNPLAACQVCLVHVWHLILLLHAVTVCADCAGCPVSTVHQCRRRKRL